MANPDLQRTIEHTEKYLRQLQKKQQEEVENNLYREINKILRDWQKKLTENKEVIANKSRDTWILYIKPGLGAPSQYSTDLFTATPMKWDTPWTFQYYNKYYSNARWMVFQSPKKEYLLPPENAEDTLAFFGVQYCIKRNIPEISAGHLAKSLVTLIEELEKDEDVNMDETNKDVIQVFDWYSRLYSESGYTLEEKKEAEENNIPLAKKQLIENNKRKRESSKKEQCKRVITELNKLFS